MARKNPFAGIMDKEGEKPENSVALDYTIKGASRSIISSIDEMASHADKLLEGETIVEVDPDLVDESFARDRVNLGKADYEADFNQVLESIRLSGQNTPALMRPHPTVPGRYMLVFGRLRHRAAKELGIKLRAVVKKMSDRDHVIAQGQENNARSNTSFIEKALFASDIVQKRYDADNATALAAIGVDKPTLSKMLSVASIEPEIISAIGRAKAVGRDRWYELKLLLDKPGNTDIALDIATGSDFEELSSEERFDKVVAKLKSSKGLKSKKQRPAENAWSLSNDTVKVSTKDTGRAFTLALKSRDASKFGAYLSDRLERLYQEFQDNGKEGGD
ncbi:plasmid partitioning protein RepB [Hoeflea sp. EC-HK425]|jgi:ParB family chromosome partitioning protein|uniref:plasmid partitioning protein RepB n=1 Tax=Hoeflea sp. EC-HK425 TaxID=2038388 RepID=UPI0012592896|nr:plasmid partitioning protein RepB [Hoeflea sp. EC-HK425]VVS96841.1 putative replication protein B [Hoeflea sp. EC-HK425]